MPSFRNTIDTGDIEVIRQMLSGTGFFEEAPDEIDVAIELAQIAIAKNNTGDYLFFFAEESGVVKGYACYGKAACTIATWELYWLCTDVKYQGEGIGKQVIGELIRRIVAQGGKKLVAQTAGRVQYLPTQKFYESLGFELEGRLKDYYIEGDDALIYSKSLSLPNGR